MSARLNVLQAAMDCIDGERRARRAIRSIEHGMAPSPDCHLHELQETLATDTVHLNATPRLRGFMRALAEQLEGVR